MADTASKYVYTDDMREISGFGSHGPDGKRYEDACRTMVVQGLEWFDAHPDAKPQFSGYKGVYGLLNEDNDDAKQLSEAMAKGIDPSGAMMQATVNHVMAARGMGWEGYVAKMRALKAQDDGEANPKPTEF